MPADGDTLSTASAVSTLGLTKHYGSLRALDRVDLAVPSGSVYGLVGPNGAGKTTMLGILAGLRTPTDGTVTIDAPTVGVVPDTPNFDRWLTGREVVELSRSLANRALAVDGVGTNETPPNAPSAILERSGLADAADRRVRGYSRGMLQRLGIAASVVNEPDLLLLDEPAAALDPAGRREVLDLVRDLRGKSTVLFSSHILDDVQEVCDEIGILRRGELVYQGGLDGLLSRYVSNRFIVRVRSGADEIASSLDGQPWVSSASATDQGVVTVQVSNVDEAEAELVKVLAESGHSVQSIAPVSSSLEEVFLEVTE
ncbi:MAG: ATP-binding cassette domain-containing protein [Acidimicrobiia bacterium]